MAKILPNPGTYNARRSGQIIVREEESGALMAYIPYTLMGSDVAFSGNHAACLGSKDETVMAKTVATLKKIFPAWNGVNPFGLEEIGLAAEGEAEFELSECFHDEYQDRTTGETKTSFKAQWLNPLGGGMPSKEPMNDDERKSVLTKWQSKFKALSATTGGKSVAKPAAKQAEAPDPKAAAPAKEAPKKPASAGPPGRKSTFPVARTATQEEVWTLLTQKHPQMSEDDLSKVYWDKVDEICPGKNGEISLQEWGTVAEALGV